MCDSVLPAVAHESDTVAPTKRMCDVGMMSRVFADHYVSRSERKEKRKASIMEYLRSNLECCRILEYGVLGSVDVMISYPHFGHE